MQKVGGVVQSKGGRVVVGAIVRVFLAGTVTPATIYSDPLGENVITELKSDNEGEYGFYVANGRYDVKTYVQGRLDGQYLDQLAFDPGDLILGDNSLVPTPSYDDVPRLSEYPQLNAQAQAIANRFAYLDTADGSSRIGFVQNGIGAVSRPVEDELRERVHIEQFGAKGDGATDDTGAYADARATGKAVHLAAGKTYLVSGLVLQSGDAIIGDPANRPTIKLKNGGNAHVISANNASDIVLRDFIVEGNKDNQGIGAGNNWRGVYLLGACHRIDAHNVWVKNTRDHGFFLSNGDLVANECGKDSLMSQIRATGCGSQAHLDAGGAGGTGMVGGAQSTTWLNCASTGNRLNGMKSNGKHIACHSYGNGGGFESGFDTPEITQTKYLYCTAVNNDGDGWRNQGQSDELTWIGCTAEGNKQAGIAIINNVRRATITGCWLKENGRDTTTAYSDTVGFAGLFISATSGIPENITVSNTQFFDDQATPTQRHHIYVGKPAKNVRIGDDCLYGPAAIQKTYVAVAAAGSRVDFGRGMGLDVVVRDISDVAVTGTTATTTLRAMTIPARSIGIATPIRVMAKGAATGTSGTKIVRLVVGGGSVVIASELAADQQDWCVEATIYRVNGTVLTVTYRAYEVGGTVTTGAFNVTGASFSSDLTISMNTTLGSAADTVTQQVWIVEPM